MHSDSGRRNQREKFIFGKDEERRNLETSLIHIPNVLSSTRAHRMLLGRVLYTHYKSILFIAIINGTVKMLKATRCFGFLFP